MLPINDALTIPEDELTFSYARSGGPGGQNVNKVSSKAILRWKLAESGSVSPTVKERIARVEGIRTNALWAAGDNRAALRAGARATALAEASSSCAVPVRVRWVREVSSVS